MSVDAQFTMAGIAFILGMLWTCITIKEKKQKKIEVKETKTEYANEPSFMEKLTDFFQSSPEVGKICTLQLFTWIGIMSLFIFFTQYAIHTVYNVPDLTSASEELKNSYLDTINKATNFSSICFAVQNLICFLVSIPIGLLSTKLL